MIPTLLYPDIVCDIPSGSIYGVYIYYDLYMPIKKKYINKYFDILSITLSGIYSAILSDILSGISSEILCG